MTGRICAVGAIALMLAACSADGAKVDTLFLSLTSDAPASGQPLEQLRVLLRQGDTRFPAFVTDPGFNLPLSQGLDPVQEAVLVSFAYDGTTFASPMVTVEVTGRIGDVPVTRFEGEIDLTQKEIVKLHLGALSGGCDADRDGFLDCGVPGCCDANSAFADCAPDTADANPWASEDACEPCDDVVDQDCDGQDAPCVDMDNDGVADCLETACGLGDGAVGPGLPELCDGVDNDCDSETDEGLSLDVGGVSLAKGAACGVGACAGGSVVCGTTTTLVCSSAGQAASETCANLIDDDCDGDTDEGCGGDVDGDGVQAAAGDCDDFDAEIYPGADEPCCDPQLSGAAAVDACDRDCSGTVTACDADDGDLDGFTTAQGDCDDTDPRVFPGAPEKCGDGIDQDCLLGDVACADVVDADNDGWSPPADCADNDDDVRPDAVEQCNAVDDDCDGATDEGNPDTNNGEACGPADGECSQGVSVCVNNELLSGVVDCVGDVGPNDELCDGLDNDCDGETDDGFVFDGAKIGESCDGVGACGLGVVECSGTDAATCSTNPDGSAPEVAVEVCDGVDNDCDGALNEELTNVDDSPCLRIGVCGAAGAVVAAMCNPDTTGTWACDYSGVPGYEAGTEVSCDALDNNCDGTTDQEFGINAGCDGDDADSCFNGTVVCDPADASKTTCDESGAQNAAESCDGEDNDCDGLTDEDFKAGVDNTTVFDGGPFASDAGKTLGDGCGTGACASGVVVCGADFQSLACSTAAAAGPDNCNDEDDDCNGVTDDDYVDGTVTLAGAVFSADDDKVKGQACGTGACMGGTVTCAASGTALECDSEGAVAEDVCDDADNDCDGETDEAYGAGGSVVYDGGPYPEVDGDKVKGAACGTGACASGEVICDSQNALALTCSTQGMAVVGDVCDDVDNDCNGVTDDDFVDGTVTLADAALAADDGKSKGAACGAGACVAGGAGAVVCDTSDDGALVCDSDDAAVLTELCDGADDDCDGDVDEGFANQDGDMLADCVDPDIDGDDVNDGVNVTGAGTPCTGGQTTGCDDNCAFIENSDQSDVDSDGVGDVCDTCSDADGDGRGRAGLDQSTCAIAGDDCDDTGGNLNDVDGDNLCVPNDNCPEIINLGQEDEDSDGAGDACDNCLGLSNPEQGNVDMDAFGDACDDDIDGDGVFDTGDGDPCTGGATMGCPDNCPFVMNADQADTDGDGIGDACDDSPPVDVVAADVCALAGVIAPAALPFSGAFDTGPAADDYLSATGCGDATPLGAGPDVVYTFTPDVTGMYTLRLAGVPAAGDPNLMYVVGDCADIANRCVGSSGDLTGVDPAELTLELMAHSTNFIVIDGIAAGDAGSGTFMLEQICAAACDGKECGADGCGGTCGAGCTGDDVCDPGGSCVAPATGDACDVPFMVTELPFVGVGDTTGETDDYTVAADGCGSGTAAVGAGAPDEVFTLTSTLDDAVYAVNVAADFPAVLYAVTDCDNTGTSCVGQTIVADGPDLNVSLSMGESVQLVVDGVAASDAGSYALTIGDPCVRDCGGGAAECGADGCGGVCGACQTGETCDVTRLCEDDADVFGNTCAQPFEVTGLPFSVGGDTDQASPNFTVGAGACTGLPAGVGTDAPDQVYRFSPPTSGPYDVTLAAAHDAALYVGAGCDAVAATCVGGVSGTGTLTLQRAFEAGNDYHIVVDGLTGDAGGAYTLSVAACVPDCSGGAECGDDGCGGVCGACGDGQACAAGMCTGCSCPAGEQCDAGGDCVQLGGNQCQSPIQIDPSALPFVGAGDTTAFADNYSVPENVCDGVPAGGGANDPDVAYQFIPSADGTYTVALDADFDASVVAVGACSDIAGSCRGGTRLGGPGSAAFNVGLLQGEVTFFIVDASLGASLDRGAYTLSVDTCQPSCGANQCGDDGCGTSCGVCGGGQACADSSQLCYATATVGNSCETARVLTAGVAGSGDLKVVDDVFRFDATHCGGTTAGFPAVGQDEVWSFTATVDGVHTVTATPSNAVQLDLSLVVSASCEHFATQCAGAESGGGAETVQLAMRAGDTYTIVVEGGDDTGTNGYSVLVTAP